MFSPRKISYCLLPLAILLTILTSCEKWKDEKAEDDPRLNDRKYCNDPEAVNYNWGFPGKPDNTVCFYPSDLYEGTYLLTDSVYTQDNVFDSAASLQTYTLELIPISKSRFVIRGFCPTDSLEFTAGRTTFRAIADTTFVAANNKKDFGQPLCRVQDTLTGLIIKNQLDSTQLFIDWRVVSDTGVNYHRGTAIKQ